jgi:signal transduction histidine kinase
LFLDRARLARDLPDRGDQVMLLPAPSAEDVSPWGWEVDATLNGAPVRRLGTWGLIGVMAATVAAIAGLAYWDASRESAAALQDFAEEQATLARALAATLNVGALAARDGAAGAMASLRSIERARALALFVHRHGEDMLRGTDGRAVASPRLLEAMARGESAVRVPRTEAAAFGLPARTALAGLSRMSGGDGAAWDIAAISTAERERDRETWANRRLVLSVLTAAGLVVLFGGVVLRTQRKELTLERELAVSSLQQSRDERLQRASKAAAMGTLAMGVAHEIATPLGIIAARAEQMASRVAGDERLAAGVSAILAQTERINQVMRGLLGLARGDAPSAERIDPRTLVVAAVGLVEHRFAKAGVPLRGDVDPGLPDVMGDPRLLEHAVVNLLLNACDACRAVASSDGVTVTAREQGGEVEIAVEDTGTGISPEDVGRALEPFFTTKAREGGTGLGLAIAQEIVANHRGTLEFAPGKPRGTRAAIRLPRAQEAHDV